MWSQRHSQFGPKQWHQHSPITNLSIIQQTPATEKGFLRRRAGHRVSEILFPV